jgi:hypothetical protein
MRRLAMAFVLVCIGAVLAISSPVLANGPAMDPLPPPGPISTSLPDGIALHAPSVIKAGQEIDVDATLAVGGYLRAGAGLHFIIDDVERRMVRTDAAGSAHFRLRGVLASGTHHLLVKFGGTRQSFYSEPASATADFVVAPLIITAQTVPAVPGIGLTLDGGKAVVSDATGEVLIAVARAGIHKLAVSLPAPTDTSRVSFVRWSDDSWQASRIIRVVKDVSISVGLRAAYLTAIQFVGLDKSTLDQTKVSDVVISGPNAELIQLQYPYEPIWLQTPMPAKHSGEGGLHVTPAPYSLSFARYNRLNVASTGQWRYSPVLGGTWSIPLLLFTLRLGARDAIFGNTLNAPIKLTGNTTGRAQIVSLDGQGRSTLVLSRGNYSAQVLTAGVTPIAAIALSRSQEVIVPVITPADLILIAFTFLVIVATVFVAGRGRLWALGHVSTVQMRFGAPIAQRWESRAPQMWAFQGAIPAITEWRPWRMKPSAPPKLEVAGFIDEAGSAPDPQSLRTLDDGFVVAERSGADLAAPMDSGQRHEAEEEGHRHEASVALHAVSTYPRSHLLGGEAGLGRAIEVGLIIRSLVSEGKAGRFLLLVHQSELQHWQSELKEKFALQIPRFERGTFYDDEEREMVWSGNPWKAFPLMLASSHLARRRDRRDELLAGGPWDVVVLDDAHEAHRLGHKPAGSPDKLLALLQAMKSSHSWKALYLTSGASRPMRLHEAWDLTDLLGLTQMPADVATDFTRYFTIPNSDRPEGDWEFLRQMCAEYFGDTEERLPRGPKLVDARLPRSRRTRRYRRSAAEAALSTMATEAASGRPQ